MGFHIEPVTIGDWVMIENTAKHPCMGMAEVKRRMGGIVDGKMH